MKRLPEARGEGARRLWPYLLLYYVLVPAVYAAVYALCALLIPLTKGQKDLGALTAAAYGILFVVTPVVTAALMRFSLLRLPLDPIAAAEIPLFIYAAMAVRQARLAHGLRAGMLLLHADCEKDAEWVRDQVLSAHPEMGEIHIGSLGVVIGAHTGPGLLTAFYLCEGRTPR